MSSWGVLASNMAKFALQSPNSKNLRAMQVDSAILQVVAEDFSIMIRDGLKVHSFYEGRGLSGLYGLHGKVTNLIPFYGFN